MSTETAAAEIAPLTPSTLLPTLQPHITALTHSLPALHHQLGLPPSALEHDLVALRDSLLNAIDAQLTARKAEVKDWEERCRRVEEKVELLRKKVGSWGKNVAVGSVEENQVLPRRLDLLTTQEHKLSGLHAAKLEQLSLLSARLNGLTPSLPINFFPSDCINVASVHDPANPDVEDVTPERFSHIERELVRGKSEITKRLTHLCHLFSDLLYLHTDLIMPFPSAPPEKHPQDQLKSSTSNGSEASDPISPCPMMSTAPEALFARFLARLEEVETEGFQPGDDLTGMEGIEPTVEATEWAENLKRSLEDMKVEREGRIQEIYDQLESLWRRLGVPEEEVDHFVEGNRGSSEECVVAYEHELERMFELRRSKMSLFVTNARDEICVLWDDLMYGAEEREKFGPFFDDDHSEELLARHEEEIERLRDEREEKATVLVHVKKWFEICDEEKELEISAQDPSRLLGKRGDAGRLLREEKMRKRVQREKPKLEKELLDIVPAWEAQHDRIFLVHGQPLRQVVEESIATSETQKENKRHNKTTRGAIPPRAQTPAEPTSRKRAPSALGNPSTAKRQKIVHHPQTAPAGRPARPLGVATNVYETPGYAAPHTASKLPSAVRSASSTTTTAYGRLGYGAPPSASTNTVRLPSSASVFGSSARIPSATEERIRQSQGRRKESFRPRPSTFGVGGGPGMRAGGARWDAVKEEDEGET